MKAILITVLAACTMIGGYASGDHCADATIVRRGEEILELRGTNARVIDTRSGASRNAPIDQVVVDTEKGPMAVIGDEAVPLTGMCEARAARRVLSGR